MKSLIMVAMFCLGGLGAAALAQEKFLPSDPIMPVEPKGLLPALPRAPANWKLTKSESANQYSEWQFTVAVRSYLEVIAPEELAALKPGEKPRAPGKTTIQVTDTGFWPAKNALFKDFAPGKAGNLEKEILDGHPLIRVVQAAPEGTSAGTSLTILWVKQRFLVAIQSSDQPDDADKVWAKRVAFDVLERISPHGAKELPNPLTMINVDELAPANNRSGRYVWAPTGKPQPSSN
jgi:hypothetical protein